MPVLTKYSGIVVRLLTHQTFGTRIHAFYGDSEMVIGVNPLRVIQSEVPAWVADWVVDWVKHYLRGRRFHIDGASELKFPSAWPCI